MSDCAHDWSIPIESTWCRQCMWCFAWFDPENPSDEA